MIKEASNTSKQLFEERVRQLCEFIQARKRKDTKAFIESVAPEDSSTYVLDRLALLEKAAEAMSETHPEGARTAYKQALRYEQRYASWATSGGEGLSRMIAVNRLKEKLAQLDRT